MTNNQKFYTEQVVNYLNLLHNENMFTMTWHNMFGDDNHWSVTIEAKNSAYRNELYMLQMLLDAMHPVSDNRPNEVEIH